MNWVIWKHKYFAEMPSISKVNHLSENLRIRGFNIRKHFHLGELPRFVILKNEAMKKLIIFFVLLIPILLVAQTNSGVITYVETIKMEWKPPADLDPAMKAQIEEMRKHMPKSIENYRELAYNDEMTYYHISPKQAEKEEQLNASGEQRGGRMMRMMGNLDQKQLVDLQKGKYVEQREFFGREFLIKDKVPSYKWKIMGEAKEISGYLCQKATTMVDTNEVVAWFCPTLPSPVGPNGYGQLPGVILELVTDNGINTLTAEKIELKPVDSKEFEEPKGGKVVTKAEYDTIVKEKIEEMREEWKERHKNGGGGMHMRVESN